MLENSALDPLEGAGNVSRDVITLSNVSCDVITLKGWGLQRERRELQGKKDGGGAASEAWFCK